MIFSLIAAGAAAVTGTVLAAEGAKEQQNAVDEATNFVNKQSDRLITLAAKREQEAQQGVEQRERQGLSDLAQGSQGAQSTLGGFDSNLQGLVGQGPETFQGFQADPGFQFRLQQGEQAINRAAAARGGRFSGRTLQELAGFSSGLASQEFGAFADRRLAAGAQFQQAAAGADVNRLSQLGQIAGFQNQQGVNQANLRSGAGQQLTQIGQFTQQQQAAATQAKIDAAFAKANVAGADERAVLEFGQQAAATGSNVLSSGVDAANAAGGGV